MLRKIKLYGQLAEFIGHKEFEVKVHSITQAVSFLIHNFPEVECFMSPKYYQVKVGNYDINENELTYPQWQWIKKFMRVWDIAENHEIRKNKNQGERS